MPAKKPSPKKATTSESKKAWINFALFSIFCASIVGILTWATDANTPQESLNPDPANSYNNLLLRGFQAGQLDMKMDTPPEMAKLADPYNPAHPWNSGYWANKVDTSYYKGKFYLYFGVTPVLALLWPYAMLTHHYLSDRYAVAIFFTVGFLIAWWLLCDVRRRYFPETSFRAFAPGIFILGVILSLTQGGSVYNLARVSGFTFVILALAVIWLALHWPKHRAWCLFFASLSYGLAIGARPSLLFGAIILLVPVLQECFPATGTVPRRHIVKSLLLVLGPITFIGFSLMAYNDFRFGSPFEFGRRYMLTFDYESTTARQFSPHYLWFNIRYYFLEPIHANCRFPFLQDFTLPSPPPGHALVNTESASILWSYPFALFALLICLVYRPSKTAPALNWFILALLLAFISTALTNCFFLTVVTAYALDFVPPLMLLAFIGFLGLDGTVARSWGKRHILRFGWYLLLGYSLLFNVLANIKARAASYSSAGDYFMDQPRPTDALECFQKAISLDPRPAMYHEKLAVAYSDTGRGDKALSELRKALEIDPNCTDAQYVMGMLLYQGGQSEEAFKYFEEALNGDPTHTQNHYALYNSASAWLIISNPDPGKRNAGLAMKLADAACRETEYKDPNTLLTTAAIFSASGQTDAVISLAQKTIVEAEHTGDSNALGIAESLLAKYQKKQTLLPPDKGIIQ